MNVQEVIDKALAGDDGIPVTPVEHSSCDDIQIEKLASALNFIGANLESTFDEMEKEASKKNKRKNKPPSAKEKARRAAQQEASQTQRNNPPRSPNRPSRPEFDNPSRLGKVIEPDVPKKVPSFMDLHSKKLKYGGGALAAGGLVYGLHKYRNRNKDQQKAASVDDVLYHAAQMGKASLTEKVAFAGTIGGAIEGRKQRQKSRKGGVNEELSREVGSGGLRGTASGAVRDIAFGVGGGLAGAGLGLGLSGGRVAPAAVLGTAGALGGLYGSFRRTSSRQKSKGELARARQRVLDRYAEEEKTSSLQKVAEDRINPARIVAGPADPYSGEIMPNAGNVSNEFVGNTRDHHALIQLKAQKVRDRINKDMKQFVNNVGDGYNLQGHLSKMNK